MRQSLGTFPHFLLLVTPLIATSALLIPPGKAATLATSAGDLSFTNFSESFSTIVKQNQGETSAFSHGGIVNVQNQAKTDSTDNPPAASTSALSSASGDSKDYLGLAQTRAKIISNFDVDASKPFSFDFNATLDLETSIDESPVENTRAIGDISFLLFDTSDIPKQNLSDFVSHLLDPTNSSIQKTPLDFFFLTGNLNILSHNDVITSQKSQNITFSDESNQLSFEGNQEIAQASITGSFQRSFNNRANLTLIAVRRNQARVVAPEPSTTLALILFCGLVVVATKKRHQANTVQIRR